MNFRVNGIPVPKQSFRYARHGGYTDPRVTAWEECVAAVARQACDKPLTGAVSVWLVFTMPNKRRVDCDNLSKNVLDSLRGIAYADDCQVLHLEIDKRVDAHNPGVDVTVEPYRIVLEDL